MSDLGLFVAAALRDKVVHEQTEEITKLRNILEPWTVEVRAPSGTVYARGKLSLVDVLRQSFAKDCNTRCVTVTLQSTGEVCFHNQLLESELVLNSIDQSNNHKMVTKRIGVPSADIGNGIWASDSKLHIGWEFFDREDVEVISGLYFNFPIPSEHWNTIHPDLKRGIGITRRDALPLAWELVENAPVTYHEVCLDTKALVPLVMSSGKAS